MQRLARRPRPGAARLLALAVAALVLGLVMPATAQADERAGDEDGGQGGGQDGEVSWSVVPAEGDEPDGRVSLRHVVDPGESVRDAVAVTNLGDRTAELDVAVGDGRVGDGGAFDIADGEAVGGGAWVRVGGLREGRVRLQAGETRVLPVRIDVPADATPGDHPAGIVVGSTVQRDGVAVQHRVGVRAHLQVSGDLDARLRVSEVSTEFEPSWVPFAKGELRVRYVVENVGNVRLAGQVTMRLGGPFGLGEHEAGTETVGELLPGETRQMSTLRQVWPTVVAQGAVDLMPEVVGEDAIEVAHAEGRSFRAMAVSWTGLVVVVVVAAVVVVRRRRRA